MNVGFSAIQYNTTQNRNLRNNGKNQAAFGTRFENLENLAVFPGHTEDKISAIKNWTETLLKDGRDLLIAIPKQDTNAIDYGDNRMHFLASKEDGSGKMPLEFIYLANMPLRSLQHLCDYADSLVNNIKKP